MKKNEYNINKIAHVALQTPNKNTGRFYKYVVGHSSLKTKKKFDAYFYMTNSARAFFDKIIAFHFDPNEFTVVSPEKLPKITGYNEVLIYKAIRKMLSYGWGFDRKEALQNVKEIFLRLYPHRQPKIEEIFSGVYDPEYWA